MIYNVGNFKEGAFQRPHLPATPKMRFHMSVPTCFQRHGVPVPRGNTNRLAAIGLLAMMACAANAQTAFVAEPARTADEFIESIGVATHWGYNNTVYGQKFARLKQLIGELGVRHTRTGWVPRVAELYNDLGIRNIVVVGPDGKLAGDEEKWWAEKLDLWAENRAAISALEGPNEVNGWSNNGMNYHGKGWPEGPRDFQAEFYRRVRGDPRLDGIPVLSLTTAYAGTGRFIAPVTGADFANYHLYAGGGPPGNAVQLVDQHLMFGHGTEILRTILTESGYHTCVPHDTVIAGNQQGVSREAHRRYIPRHLAVMFNAGFAQTIIYEFAAGRPNKKEDEDPEAAFGLLDPDGEPKPAYFALKNLLAALNEPDREKARGHQPGALAFAFDNAPETLCHTLLQKADGAFVLLVWNEVSSWNLQTKKDIANKPLDVTLRLQNPASSATVIAGLGGTDNAPATKLAGPVEKIALKISDEITVVELAANGDVRPPLLPAPTHIVPKPEPTSITLSWPAAADETCWVGGHGPARMAEKSEDGKAWRFTASGLIPDRVYTFEIVAATPGGKRSEPARVKARTLPHWPDLTVRDVILVNERGAPVDKDTLEPGMKIGFSAVVENIGNAPTPEGVTLGVKFGVDGRTVAWHDQTRKALAPGGKITVTANSGPSRLWTVAPGTHKILADADDVNRIMESNELNNRLEIEIKVAEYPDLTLSVNKIKPVTVTLANLGNNDVPAGEPIRVALFDRATPPRKNLAQTDTVAGLPTGKTLTLAIPVGDALPETFYVVVDDPNRVRESDKSNNQVEVKGEIEDLADLVISVNNANLAGKTVAVTVANLGNADIPPGTSLAAVLYDRAAPPRKNFGYATHHGGLPAGQTLRLNIPVGAALPNPLPATLCVVVDDQNRFKETNKANNSALVFPKP